MVVKAGTAAGRAKASAIRAGLKRAQKATGTSGVKSVTVGGETTFISGTRVVSSTDPQVQIGAQISKPALVQPSPITVKRGPTPGAPIPQQPTAGLLRTGLPANFQLASGAAIFVPPPRIRKKKREEDGFFSRVTPRRLLVATGILPTPITGGIGLVAPLTKKERVQQIKLGATVASVLGAGLGGAALIPRAGVAALRPVAAARVAAPAVGRAVVPKAPTALFRSKEFGKEILKAGLFFETAGATAKVGAKVTAPRAEREFIPVSLSDLPFVSIIKPSPSQLVQRRAQQAAARSASERGFFPSVAAALPFGAVSTKKTKAAFEKSIRAEFKERGLTGKRLETAVRAQKRLAVGTGIGETAGLLAISTQSELFGQRLVKRSFAATARKPFKRPALGVGKRVFAPIATAGAVEGFGTVFGVQRARELPVRPGQVAAGAGLGALSAGIFGSVIAGGAAARGRIGRGIGKTTALTGFIADPFEKPGDIIAGAISATRARIKRVPVLTPALVPISPDTFITGIVPTTKPRKGRARARVLTPALVPTRAKVPTRARTFVPVSTAVPITTFVPVPTRTPTPTTTVVPVPTAVPTRTPTFIPALTPTTVPVTAIVPKVPLFLPFPVGFPSRRAKPSRFSGLFGAFTPSLRGILSGKIERTPPKFFTGAEIRGLRPETAAILGIAGGTQPRKKKKRRKK